MYFELAPESGVTGWWFQKHHTKLKPLQKKGVEAVTSDGIFHMAIARREIDPTNTWASIFIYERGISGDGLSAVFYIARKKEPLTAADL